MIRLALNMIRWLIVAVLFVATLFGVGLLATDYYTHTEAFYESLNPDVLMAMHEYVWECTNETTEDALKCGNLRCFDTPIYTADNKVYCGNEDTEIDNCEWTTETRKLCGWKKWVVDK